MRLLIPALFAACAPNPELAEDVAGPPPSMTLEAPDQLFRGETNTFTVTGNLGQYERVYLVMSRTGTGLGPCPSVLGGQCLSLLQPRLLGDAWFDGAEALIDVTLPPAAMAGTEMHFQAAVVRGIRGLYSTLSNTTSLQVQDYILGCMNPVADNYDPSVTVDNGTCQIGGCMDPESPAFNPEATYDDGSCPPPVWAVWDPARSAASVTYTNANRAAAASGNNNNVWASVGKSSGKWYWEVTWTAVASAHLMVGAGTASAPSNTWTPAGQGAFFYSIANNPYTTLPFSGTNRGYGGGAVIGFALDMDARTLTHYVNGLQGATVTGLPATEVYPMIAYAHGNVVTINAGQEPFAYTPPAGFQAGLWE